MSGAMVLWKEPDALEGTSLTGPWRSGLPFKLSLSVNDGSGPRLLGGSNRFTERTLDLELLWNL